MMHSIIRYVVNEIKVHCNLRLELGKRASKRQPRAGKQVANSDVIAASPGPVLVCLVAANLPSSFHSAIAEESSQLIATHPEIHRFIKLNSQREC
jgi:hypothetical protein